MSDQVDGWSDIPASQSANNTICLKLLVYTMVYSGTAWLTFVRPNKKMGGNLANWSDFITSITWNSFKKVATKFKKKLFNKILYCLTVTAWCLQTIITWWYELDFFTVWHHFSPRCAFWHTAVLTMHSLWTYQCFSPTFIFADSEKWQFGIYLWWLPRGGRTWLRAAYLVLSHEL